MISIDIFANLPESFYDAIDNNTGSFTESPFSVYIKMNKTVLSFTIGQYAPVNIHVTRYLEVDKPIKIVISTDYQELKNVNIHAIIERV